MTDGGGDVTGASVAGVVVGFGFGFGFTVVGGVVAFVIVVAGSAVVDVAT
jgi:hypothetical protein